MCSEKKNGYKLAIESMVHLLDGISECVAHARRKNVCGEKNGYKLAIESMILLLDGNSESVAQARRKKCAQSKK